MNEHIVTPEEANSRIDKLLATLNSKVSRSQVQKWFDQSLVNVNQTLVKANYRCRAGDIITWSLPEQETMPLTPEDISLDIIHEDADILVIQKEKGMVVHPSPGHPSGTLVNALLHYGTALSHINGEARPGIVHRIDKDTSGLLVIAKHDAAHQNLAKQLKDHTMLRHYAALVHGEISHEQGIIDAPIGRDPKNRKRMAITDAGKEAITHFHVKMIWHGFSYVVCQLKTGRTHQIRVHMKHIGHPLVGDVKYSSRKTLDVNGQALHAGKIGFYHPRNVEWMEFETDLPAYFQRTMEKLKKMY